MRIVAGKYRGRVLSEFDLPNTRPTSDMLRESLFNILYSVEDSVFLDLFAGTGAVGFEALSRGAKQAYMVEHNINSYKVIVKNAQTLKAENVKIIRSDFKDALLSFKKQGIVFDFVFLDPPYKSELAEESLVLLREYGLLHDSSIVVWEHEKYKENVTVLGYDIVKFKKYGDKCFKIMQLSA